MHHCSQKGGSFAPYLSCSILLPPVLLSFHTWSSFLPGAMFVRLLYQLMYFTVTVGICEGFNTIWQANNSQMGLRSARDSTVISVNGMQGSVEIWTGATGSDFCLFCWLATLQGLAFLRRPIWKNYGLSDYTRGLHDWILVPLRQLG